MLFIAGKFLYDWGYINATFYYDSKVVESRIADPKDRVPLEGLQAAQQSAKSAQDQAILSFLGLVVSSLALVGLAISLRQTHETINNARTMAEAEATCYLHASEIKWSSRGRLTLYCVNTGNTPAAHFSIGCHAYIETRGQISDNLRLGPARLKIWSALAGHSEYTVSLSEIDQDQIKQFLAIAGDRNRVLVVSGNIYYTNVFGKTFKTQFAFYTSSAALDAKFARPTARLEVHSPVAAMPIEIG